MSSDFVKNKSLSILLCLLFFSSMLGATVLIFRPADLTVHKKLKEINQQAYSSAKLRNLARFFNDEDVCRNTLNTIGPLSATHVIKEIRGVKNEIIPVEELGEIVLTNINLSPSNKTTHLYGHAALRISLKNSIQRVYQVYIETTYLRKVVKCFTEE
ncbi:hypothetical protein [Bacteriovorax sp. Seq25_V]|uniref:hypothetical protein n=1 Tax=Bacteriovorax sp. Seq25_V TaxID=1201288 RepID=UPI00041637E3|nr:hypothetical protein [Bacteriovorax sp. Seq25_V]